MYVDAKKAKRAQELTEKADVELRSYIEDLERVCAAAIEYIDDGHCCTNENHAGNDNCLTNRLSDVLTGFGF